MVQCINVAERIREMEMHPFIQECLLLLPANMVLGNIGIMNDKTIAHATPVGRVIGPPMRLMFA